MTITIQFTKDSQSESHSQVCINQSQTEPCFTLTLLTGSLLIGVLPLPCDPLLGLYLHHNKNK